MDTKSNLLYFFGHEKSSDQYLRLFLGAIYYFSSAFLLGFTSIKIEKTADLLDVLALSLTFIRLEGLLVDLNYDK